MINNKIIIKRWNEDDMEKVGFFDESGNFHMLKGIAKDFRKPELNEPKKKQEVKQ